MGENKGKGDEKEKKGGGSEKKKEEGPPKVVLKVDLHCEGCASKIKRRVRRFEGVDGVTVDMASNKLTVIGTADPWKLREYVEAKTRKKVEIVSPVNPPKEPDSGKKAATGDGKKPSDGEKKPAHGEKKPEAAGDSKEKKPDSKKSKEPAASIVVLKIRLHCDGCIQRINKTIFKMKGVQEVSIDAQKDLVTVKGTMDVAALPSRLKEKLSRGVEIVAVTSAAAGGGGGGGGKKDKPAAAGDEKKEKSSGGGGGGGEGEKKGNGGGEKKGKEGGGGGGKESTPAAAESTAVEANKMEYYGGPYGNREQMMHAPQLFSDENPNACSVM